MKPSYVKTTHPWFGDEPFRTVSAFSTAQFFDKWLRGQGGKWEELIERFIDRSRSQKNGAPIRGGRVFMQTCDWVTGDHPFFSRRATAARSGSPWGFDSRMWDYGQLVRGERPRRLTVHNQKLFLRLIQLARKHDWKWEFSMDATLKHTKGVGWFVIGHVIRQCNAFLNAVHTAKWDAETMGHPTNSESTARVRAMFDEVAGPIDHLILVETHNEWDAHSRGAWEKDGLNHAQALREVNMQLERMRRVKDGVPEQWPAGGIIVSHGGRDDIEYDANLATAVAIHPSRPSTRVGDRFRHLRKYGKPIYANEILHYIDPSMWYLVENGTFRPGSSTKNTKDRARFVDEMLDDGMWVCEHSLVGMANGVWKDEDVDFEEMPLDEYEKSRGATLGGSGPSVPPLEPAPPETPKPEPPTPPSPGGVKVINGVNFRSLQFEEFPVVVDVAERGNEPWSKSYRVDIKEFEIGEVDFFFGHDKGDSFEIDVTIFADDDQGREHLRYFVARRIEEKVAPGGEANLGVVLNEPVVARVVKINVLLRVTGPNVGVHKEHPSHGKWRANFDLDVMLIGR